MASLLFIAKKVISFCCSPLGIFLILLILAFVLRKHARGVARFCLLLAPALLLLLAIPLTATLLLYPLEARHSQYANPAQLNSLGVKNIVVLGAGVRQGSYSVYDQVGFSGLNRVLYGVELYKAMPGSKLYLSGGGFGLNGREAIAMAELARALGVAERDMIMEQASWDTADQAQALGSMLGKEPFVLVTSAWHMPRSELLFKQQGLAPYLAPTDFQARAFNLNYETLLPSAHALRLSELAIKEYLGWLWAWL